jgi:benzodiazapine receptor
MKPLAPKYGTLIGCILLVFCTQAIGAFLMKNQVSTWYQTLIKPSFTPPSYVFGPVWTILYLMMAIALWVYIEKSSPHTKLWGYVFFAFQLFFNLIWTYLFFGLESPGIALVDIALLWIAIALTIYAFYQVTPLAAYLLIPYFIWVSYACALNLSFYHLNR